MTWFAQPGKEEAEGRPLCRLQLPHEGKQKGRCRSILFGDQR